MKGLIVFAGMASATVATLGIVGCAGPVSQTHARIDLDAREQPSLRVSGSSVVDSRVSPLVPVEVTSDAGTIQVRFAQRGHVQALARLDAASGQVQSVQTTGVSGVPQAAQWGATRVMLEGGRFIVCWTQESSDGSRHAMARLWNANGSAIGDAVMVSPEDADVLGAPKAASADGKHAVITFASSSGKGFDLRAVSLEDTTGSTLSEATAAR